MSENVAELSHDLPSVTVFFALKSFHGLFVHDDSRWAPGGAEVQMWQLAMALSRCAGVEVVLLSEEELGLPADGSLRSIQYRRPIVSGFPIISRRINAGRKAAMFKSETPVKVLLMSQVEDGWLIDAAKESGVDVAYRVNGDSLVDGRGLHSESHLALVHERILKADLVIAQTFEQQALIAEHFQRQSAVTGSGADLGDVAPGKLRGDLYGLWIGRCDAIKRPWLFVELARQIPNHRFRMVMVDEDAALAAVIRAEAGSLGNLELLPRVPRSQISELYAGAAFLCNTSISEGIPNTFIEAAARARPILSHSVNPSGMLDDGEFGVCAQGQTNSLVEVARALLDDEDRMLRMGREARKFALSEFDIDVVAGRYLDAFRLLRAGGSCG